MVSKNDRRGHAYVHKVVYMGSIKGICCRKNIKQSMKIWKKPWYKHKKTNCAVQFYA